jgi:hypothetical protein
MKYKTGPLGLLDMPCKYHPSAMIGSTVCNSCHDFISQSRHNVSCRKERNEIRRETNQILRDLTGTSARAAREDMGL